MLRIVILGDIVGKPGVRAVVQQMPVIRQRYRPDLVVANAENAANGTGLTPSLYQRLCEAGVDGMTLGDHVYKKIQITKTLNAQGNIIRPANLPPVAAGKVWMRLQPRTLDGETTRKPIPPVYVLTVLGRLFVNMPANDPFAIAAQVIEGLPEPAPIVLLEVHAEATSEKKAMGWHFNGRVACVFGTHTHVPTADARILPTHLPEGTADSVDQSATRGGTAYISDLGMCGPHDSVLGRRVDRVLHHMTTSMPIPFDVAEGDPRVQGVVVEIDPQTHRAVRIESIDLAADVTQPPFGTDS